jgi:phosphoribosylglycinamide formyltransferase-1
MKSILNIALFASGSGSNAQNIAEYFSQHPSLKIDSIYANKEEAFVLQRAAKLAIPAFYFPNSDFREGTVLLQKLRKRDVDIIVLAGFLLKIPPILLEAFPNRIINIHPALLPKYGGKGMFGAHVHEAVKAANESETGITIHLVNEHYDEGQILFQAQCAIEADDQVEQIAEKVHALEYAHFPHVIETFVLSMK